MFWKKLNTQIRNVCLAIQIKKNSHFRFRSPFSFQKLLFWPKFSQFSIFFSFFLFKGKKVVYTSFQREIPCSRPLHVFFSPKTPLLTKVQWISMQDVAQIGFFFFFTKKKSYLQLVSEGNSLLQTFEQSLTTLVLITHSIFFSFPPLLLRLREVDFIGRYETVDQQTAEPPKTLWICKYVHVEHWVK